MSNNVLLKRMISAAAALCCLTSSFGYTVSAVGSYQPTAVFAVTDGRFDVDPTPVNPDASPEARELLKFIADNYGKKIITGQCADNGQMSSEFKVIKDELNEQPAILGMDLYRYLPVRQQHGDSCQTVEYAEKFYKRGGIVTLYWHWNAPEKYYKSGTDKDGNPRWWGGFYTDNIDMNKFDLAKIMSGEDKEGYDLLMADIDAIAVQLQRLRDAGVPVLFRPLHEASGNYGLYGGTGKAWFWWGSSGPETYKQLYKLLYDRLTNEYGLNNLIWVWNAQRADWYPGDEYVDIVGEDVYPGKHKTDPQTAKFNTAMSYTSSHKVIAMTENGCLFDPDEALSSGSAWSYFCTWQGSFTQSAGKISEEYSEKSVWEKVYHSDNTIKLGDMPRHTHAYNQDYAVTVKPTYTEDGYTENYCLTCGRKSKTDIVPKKTLPSTKITGFTPAASSVTLTWDKVSAASGYKLLKYNSTTKKYVQVKKVTGASNVSADVTGLSSGKTYKFKVQPYVTQNGKTANASESAAFTAVTKPAKTSITKTSSTKNSVTLKWKKVTASGYKVQQYNAKTKKWKSVKTLSSSKTSFKITKLKKNTSYKFRIVAYKKLGSKSYNGAASAAKTVRTKKK